MMTIDSNHSNASSLPHPEPPRGDRLELWHAQASSTDAGPTERFCEQWLVEEEHASAARFRVAKARNQHVIGRGMARCLLSHRVCDARQIQIETLEQGKPFVQSPEAAIRPFNIAHTDGLVMCGLASGARWIGVDVECLERRTDTNLARRYFASSEVAQLDRVRDEDERCHRFLKIWTLKEAFIKAIGTGLRTPLDAFWFEDSAADQPTITFADSGLDQGRYWRFKSFEPRPGFIAAVAIGDVAEDLRQNVRLGIHAFEKWSQTRSVLD
ncbi:MAG: 4'-phosphopantetheinyl transferase superfamily protein [Planctomycetota bacterium]